MPSSAFETYLDCFLWDLVDEGIDTALDRIKNETGVTGICIQVHCRGLTLLRPHAGVSPREFKTEGGAQFQPDITRYAGTRLRPIVPKWLRKTNPLKAVVEGCRNRGLKVTGHILGGFNLEMTDRYPHAAIQDVFGEKTTWLCPLNPDVQEYVRALLADVSENYALDQLRVGGLGFPFLSNAQNHAFWGEKTGLYIGQVETWLRGLCFCDSCRQTSKREDVDIDAVADLVRDSLERLYQTGECHQDTLNSFVQDRPQLATYVKWRSSQMESWLASFRRVCKCSIMLEQHQGVLASGIHPESVGKHFDGYCTWPDELRRESLDSKLRDTSKICGIDKVCVMLDAGTRCQDSNMLVAALNQAAKAGCHSASIWNYGTIPLARLEWIRQAVRFARRETL